MDVTGGPGRLTELGDRSREQLAGIHAAREEVLTACRSTIRACGRAIRATHRHQPETYKELVGEAEVALRRAQAAARPHPAIAGGRFLHDAEKEYAEARLTAVLIAGAVGRAGSVEGSTGGWPAGRGVPAGRPEPAIGSGEAGSGRAG
ncbi:MAG: hypothetical protein ACRD0J_08810, partial [Acidimicrobiales bacterium]